MEHGRDNIADAAGKSASARLLALWLQPALIASVTIAVFLPALRCGFVTWDDDRNILQNPGFRGFDLEHLRWMFSTFYGGHYQPLTWLSFAVDHAVWGLQPVGYHLTNVVLHALVAVLFYFVALRLMALAVVDHAEILNGAVHEYGSTILHWCAAFAALLFAVHPLRVESVVWVTERRDVLSGVFFCACLIAYLRAIQPSARAFRWLVLAWVCMLLSLLAKAVAVTLPLVMLIIDAYPARRLAAHPRPTRLIVEKLPFFLLSVVAGVLAIRAQQSAGAWRSLAAFGPMERVVSACSGMGFYLWKSLVPVELSPLYPLPTSGELLKLPYVLAVPVLALLLAGIVMLRRHLPAAGVAFLAYVVLLAPMSGLAQSGKHLAADRYSYLALMPFAVLAGGGLYRWLTRSHAKSDNSGLRIPLAVAALLVIGLTVLTVRQTQVWKNSESLWRQVLSLHPESSVAAVNLANELAPSHAAEALELFRRAAAHDPHDAKAQNGLGRMLLELAKADEALMAFQEAVRLAPQESGYRANLGYTLAGFGRLDEAIAQYCEALTLDPRNAASANMLGELLLNTSQYEAARNAFEIGLKAAPDDRALAGNLAWLLATCPADGVRNGQRALELAQAIAERTAYADPWALNTLAAAYAETGQFKQAMATVDAALRLAQQLGAVELAESLQARRAGYANGQPYREP